MEAMHVELANVLAGKIAAYVDGVFKSAPRADGAIAAPTRAGAHGAVAGDVV